MPKARQTGGFISKGNNPLLAPNPPSIVSATAGNAQGSIAFTAPADTGGGAITGYIVLVKDSSSGAGFANSGSSSPIVVSGLTNDNTYVAYVAAVNEYGVSQYSAVSSSFTPLNQGEQSYTTAGTYSWVAPTGFTSVSVVAVGGGGGAGAYGGGGAGGALAYKNNITVVPGNSYTVVVGTGGATSDGSSAGYAGTGGSSSFTAGFGTLTATGGGGGYTNGSNSYGGAGGTGGTPSGTYDGGGNGGNGGTGAGRSSYWNMAGGGGAGGYSGNGGNGGDSGETYGNAGTAGSGGGGGGGGGGADPTNIGYGYGGGGGGVGILGQGSNGTAGVGRVNSSGSELGQEGGGGSGGGAGSYSFSGFGKNVDGTTSSTASGGQYGGGAANAYRNGAGGAVRIIWPGDTRQFPSTNTGGA